MRSSIDTILTFGVLLLLLLFSFSFCCELGHIKTIAEHGERSGAFSKKVFHYLHNNRPIIEQKKSSSSSFFFRLFVRKETIERTKREQLLAIYRVGKVAQEVDKRKMI